MISWTRSSILRFSGFAIICGVGIGLAVLLGITIADTYSVSKEIESNLKTPFELNDFLSGAYSGKLFNGFWITDNDFLFKNKEGDVLKFNADTQTKSIFLEKSVLDNYKGAVIKVSEDQKFVLIEYNASSVFRHSKKSQFAVYDLTTNNSHDLHDKKFIQYASFDKMGHSIAYVYENNIYYLKDPENADNPKQITKEGVPSVFYCGVPDWVYEEEVLGTGSAMWFSPDGQKLAFATFDDTNVDNFTYIIYGEPGSLKDQYTTPVTIKYPKVGTPNPIVKLYIYNLETDALIKPIIEEENNEKDFILYDVTWVNNDQVSLISSNRVQNKATITKCSLNGKCEEEQKFSEETGWLDPKIPLYDKKGTWKLEILPKEEGNDRFDHLVITDLVNQSSLQLTFGKKIVTNIYGWDEDHDIIYYAGTAEDTPSQMHIYSVNSKGYGNDKCLTCEMKVQGVNCTYAVGLFSKDNSYYTKVCKGPKAPFVTIEGLKHDLSIVWENNSALNEKLENKQQLTSKDLKVNVSNGFQARVRILVPEDFDENKVYPTIVYVYAGPNSNLISDAYAVGFENYLVSNKKYLYVLIDARGSGKDGKNKLFELYRKLGTIEIEDQIAVTKYLQDNYKFIDKENTGIWGWSYGGFTTGWALVKDKENIFKCGISVAPVTDWIYYDSIYTERYMGLPKSDDNLEGYNNSDITRNVDGFKNKTYYLIHGNADDNVHYQQSMVLSKALEAADILFEQQSYPDENHSLGHVSAHLYHSMERFWDRCFESRHENDQKESSNAI
ncbi:unnamed protein product [Brassicogethes aeneus]|uniref:Venom dipeptidyl peptidase 4 n=1 Tax=Brassicogethes aeneus TaxID=1431903 RepID=A0A9P0B3Q4_BRAAE|nr:unnamed protein product [Brassicogethes aeneus]